LLVISLMLTGAQVAYDAPGALAPFLKRSMGITGERLGLLYSAYHLPNLVMVFLGGIVIDAVGADVTAIGLSIVVLLSTVAFALANGFEVLIVSRVVLGLGGEALNVAQVR